METSIAYTEVVKHIKQYENKSRLKELQKAVEADQTGVVYLYAKGGIKFEIKRYRTGRFIKKTWH